jgi:hypothetical protein
MASSFRLRDPPGLLGAPKCTKKRPELEINTDHTITQKISVFSFVLFVLFCG